MTEFKVLIVDDNYEKVELVGKASNENLDCKIEYVNNTKDALQYLRDNTYDLLIVDMNLPKTIGESPSITSGAELIDFVYSSPRINKPLSVIAATSHEDAFEKNRDKIANYGLPFVLTTLGSDKLKSLVSKKISYYQQVKEGFSLSKENSTDGMELPCPDKITIKWLIHHVDWKHWCGAIFFLIATFSFGVKFSKVDFISELYNLNTTKVEISNQQTNNKG